MPGFDEKIEVSVIDIFAERMVGEHVINAVVRETKMGGCSGGNGCRPSYCKIVLKGSGEPVQFPCKYVPRATLSVLGSDIVNTCQVAVDLGEVERSIPIKH